MKEMRQVPQGAGLYALYLQKEEGGNIRGWFLPESGGAPVEFSSLSRMVFLLEQAMDVPQEGVPSQAVQTPDFELEILFRQNCSWQGVLRRPGNKNAQPFRSVLELLSMLECAMVS